MRRALIGGMDPVEATSMASSSHMADLMKLAPQDNVAIALGELRAGETVTLDGTALTVDRDIAVGHKVAACDIVTGSTITKYNCPIGLATQPISEGTLRAHPQRQERLPPYLHLCRHDADRLRCAPMAERASATWSSLPIWSSVRTTSPARSMRRSGTTMCI